MSRARPVVLPDGTRVWFDMARGGERASDEQIELLVLVEQVDLDDLLDTVVTQAEVLRRLRYALGQEPVPTDVLERRERWRQQRQALPVCRKCGKEGDSTKHHFVNKWVLRELSDYVQRWADRSKNCIPVCIDCHRHLHLRDDDSKSIVGVLTDEERAFADAALTALSEQRPKLLILVARGSRGVYECCLVQDWILGRFDAEEDSGVLAPPHLRVAS